MISEKLTKRLEALDPESMLGVLHMAIGAIAVWDGDVEELFNQFVDLAECFSKINKKVDPSIAKEALSKR